MDLITTPVAFGQSPPKNSILHSTSVSFTGRSPSEPVHIVQYDLTVPVIAISLTANGQPYTVPSGAAVNIRLAKPDGHYVYDPAYGVSDDGQTVYIAVTGQMTVAAGKTQPVIEVVVDSGTAATGSFTLVIDENPVPDSALQSSDEYLTMQQILTEVQAAAQLVEENQENLQNLTDNLEAVQNASANAQAAAASAAAAQQSAEKAAQSAQQALGFRTFFGAIVPDENGNLDPSRPMTTAAAQASWTVKSKGDRIQSVQVNGPGGIRLLHYIADENDLSEIQNLGHVTRFQFSIAPLTVSGSIGGYSNRFAVFDGYSTDTPHAYAYGSAAYFFIPNDTILQSGNLNLQEAKKFIASQRAIGIIYEIWAKTGNTSVTSRYIPIIANGHEYRCQCLPLAEALGAGDNVQSNVPSGCDKKIVFDSTNAQNWESDITNDPQKYRYKVKLQNPLNTDSSPQNNKNAYTNFFHAVRAGRAYYLDKGFTINASDGYLYIYDEGESLSEWKEKFLSEGFVLVLYYKSTSYIPQYDLLAELETHANGNVYAHPAVELVAVPHTDKDSGHAAGTYDVSSRGGATVSVSLKPMQDGGNAATVGGYTAQELIAGSGDIDAATLNGQTAQQILQSAESTAQGYTQSYTQSYVQQQTQNFYTKAQTQQIVPFLYKATFDVDGWMSSGSGYTQTVAVTPVNGGPAITSQSVMTSAVTVDDTVQGSAGNELDAAASIVNGGTKTFGSGTITCVIQGSAPTADAEVFFTASGGGN